MPIFVVCDCGQRLRVKREHAGRAVTCPACARKFQVPRSDDATAVTTVPRARTAVTDTKPTVVSTRVEEPEEAEELPRLDRGVAFFSRMALTAAFAISPLAGGWIVLAINQWRCGRRVAAVLALLPIPVAFAALAALAVVAPQSRTLADGELPAHVGTFALAIMAIHLGGLTYLALWWLRRMVAGISGIRLATGGGPQGPRASAWLAIGFAVVCAVLVVGVTFGALYVTSEVLDERLGQEIVFDNQQKVHFSSTVTQVEAERLRVVLVELQHFRGNRGQAIHVTREQGRVVVSIPVTNGSWDRPDVQAWFRSLREPIAQQAFPGEPVAIRLCDLSWRVKRVLE
jgi:hypothetical protein